MKGYQSWTKSKQVFLSIKQASCHTKKPPFYSRNIVITQKLRLNFMPTSTSPQSEGISSSTHPDKQCDCLYFNGTKYIEDHYDYEYSNLISYLLYGAYPTRVNDIKDRLIVTRHKRNMKQRKGELDVYQCHRGRYHIKNKVTKLSYPMLYKTFEMLKNIHEPDHLVQSTMRRKISFIKNYDTLVLEKYVYGFLKQCTVCAQTRVEVLPRHRTWRDSIYVAIKEIQENKFQFSPSEMSKKLERVEFDMEICEYDCTKDHYGEEDEKMREYLLKDRLSQLEMEMLEPKRQAERLQNTSMNYQVVKCRGGTDHLWKRREYSESASLFQTSKLLKDHRRVPMQAEKLFIAMKLHGATHRPLCDMLILAQKTHYTYGIVKDYLQKNLEFCQYCAKKSPQERKIKSVVYQEEKEHTKVRSKAKVKPESTQRQKLVFNSEGKAQVRKHQRHQLTNKLNRALFQIGTQKLIVRNYQGQQGIMAIISTNYMRNSYECFGESLHYEAFPDLLQEQQGWLVYILSGLDFYGEEVIFAIVLLDRESMDNFYYSLKEFFSIMNSKPPQTICTKYLPQLGEAVDRIIEEYKMRTDHVYFPYTTITNLYKTIALRYRTEAGRLFAKLIKAFYIRDYENMINAINNLASNKNLPHNKKVLASIIREEKKCCLCKMPERYMRKVRLIDNWSTFATLLYCKVQTQESIGKFLSKVLDYSEKELRIQKCHLLRSDFKSSSFPLKFFELHFLRDRLCTSIYQELFLNCIASQNLKLLQSSSGAEYQIQDSFQTFEVKYVLSSNHWACSCGELQREGIPCSHLIKIIIRHKGLLEYYLNDRWLCN